MADTGLPQPTVKPKALALAMAENTQRFTGVGIEFFSSIKQVMLDAHHRLRAAKHAKVMERFQAASPERQRQLVIKALRHEDPHLLRDVFPE